MTNFDPMLVILGIGFAVIVLTFWHAQRQPGFKFDAFDLIMEDGRVSKISFAFMLVLAVTTWVIVDLQIKGKLTEGYFTMYGTMWVLPLVAKVVFGKSEMPSNSTFTSLTEKTTTSKTGEP